MHSMSEMGATRPILSMLAILILGSAAVLLIPSSGWDQRGALIIPGTVLTLALLSSVFFALFRNPVALFRTELIIMFGLVYWLVLDAVQARYGLNVGKVGITRLFTGTVVFATFFWAGTALASAFGKPAGVSSPPVSDVGHSFIFWAALACALMGISYDGLTCELRPSCFVEVAMQPRFGATWRLDPTWAPLKRLRYAGYLAVPLTIAYFMVKRRLNWRGAILIFLVLVNCMLLLNDGRRAIGTTLGAGILIFVLLNERIRFRHLLLLVGGAFMILVLLEAMVAWRNEGFGRSLVSGRAVETGPGIIAVDKNIYHGSRAMEVVPRQHPHTGLAGAAYTFGQLIPRSIWNRPAKFGFNYAVVTRRAGGASSWTATYSIIGDLWIIGGYLALVLGGIFYGVLANLASRLLLQPVSLRSRLLFTVATMAIFVSLRAMYEITVTGLALLAIWGLLKARDMFIVRKISLQRPALPARALYDRRIAE